MNGANLGTAPPAPDNNQANFPVSSSTDWKHYILYSQPRLTLSPRSSFITLAKLAQLTTIFCLNWIHYILSRLRRRSLCTSNRHISLAKLAQLTTIFFFLHCRQCNQSSQRGRSGLAVNTATSSSRQRWRSGPAVCSCLLYTSDAADE